MRRLLLVVALVASILIAPAPTASAAPPRPPVTIQVVNALPGGSADAIELSERRLVFIVKDDRFPWGFYFSTVNQLASNLAFGETTAATIIPGAHRVVLQRATTGRTLAVGLVSVSAHATVAVHLGVDGLARVTTFGNPHTPIPDGRSRVTIRHAAGAGALDVTVSAAPVSTGTDPPAVVSRHLSGRSQFTTVLDAGTYHLTVASGGSNLVTSDVDATAGKDVVVYLVGSPPQLQLLTMAAGTLS